MLSGNFNIEHIKSQRFTDMDMKEHNNREKQLLTYSITSFLSFGEKEKGDF